jgi:hypothetical protein
MNNVETLYSYAGAATTTTPTAGAVSLIGSYPPIVIPPGYFSKLGANSSSLRLHMGGVIVTTAVIPTFLWSFYLTAATVTPAAFLTTIGPVAATSAITPATAQTTGCGFDLELHLTARTLTQVASSVIVSGGTVQAASTLSGGWTFPAIGAAPTFSTWEMDLSYFLWPALTLGAATAGNTVTTHYAKLYGEN